MTTDLSLDAYGILQVDPGAHRDVIKAAYYALARLYHPDGDIADTERMAELNRAYDLLRDDVRRHEYDARRALLSPSPGGMRPVGPGYGNGAEHDDNHREPVGSAVGSSSSTMYGSVAAAPGPFTARARARQASSVIDFGRYEGWTLRELLHHDPDYLRWLSRHSSGIRFRGEILRLLAE